MQNLNGNVALVTGGASGLGKAIAQRFAKDGARVVITDIQTSLGQSVAADLGCDFLEQDVTAEDQWPAIIAQIQDRHGDLHVLVNNAGILGSMDAINPENTRLEDWRRIFTINVESVFLGCRAAIPAMRRAGRGSIINMSSVAGILATPYATAYGASKAAVRQMTKSVAQHCAEQRLAIRCNSIHPGNILTPLWLRQAEEVAAQRGITADEYIEQSARGIPLGGFTLPDDIAAAAAFLASDDSRHVTGTMIVVDGGITQLDTYRLGLPTGAEAPADA